MRYMHGMLQIRAAPGLGCSRFGLLWIWTTTAFGTGRGRVGAGLQTVFLPWFDGSRCRERGRLRPLALLGESSVGFMLAWK